MSQDPIAKLRSAVEAENARRQKLWDEIDANASARDARCIGEEQRTAQIIEEFAETVSAILTAFEQMRLGTSVREVIVLERKTERSGQDYRYACGWALHSDSWKRYPEDHTRLLVVNLIFVPDDSEKMEVFQVRKRSMHAVSNEELTAVGLAIYESTGMPAFVYGEVGGFERLITGFPVEQAKPSFWKRIFS